MRKPSYFLKHPEELREDNIDYSRTPYPEICKARANKAEVYKHEDNTPLMDIYDHSGQISYRYALIKGKWTTHMHGGMIFGNDNYRISVEEFLELVKQAQASSKQVKSRSRRISKKYRDPDFYVKNPEYLFEDDLDYANLTYTQICQQRAGRAAVYISEDGTPMMKIFGEKGDTSYYVALLGAYWSSDMPPRLAFDNCEIYCTDVQTFLETVQNIQSTNLNQ